MEIRTPFHLTLPHKELDCTPFRSWGAQVMGILNVTPDSFFDGGHYTSIDQALKRVETMLSEGAVIIDIGGESTRPGGRTYGKGAAAIAEETERARVLPIIEAISRHFPEAVLSIDTYKPTIAKEAIEAGAHIINDITGLRLYPEMASVAASLNVPLILMHSLGKPGELPHEHHYRDVTKDVLNAMKQALSIATDAGVQQLVTDPGFGFGKTPAENIKLMKDVDQFLALGFPVLIGVSRKSTIGAYLGNTDIPAPVDQRLFGSLGVTAAAVLRGASIVRTHDVQPTVEFLKTMGATLYT